MKANFKVGPLELANAFLAHLSEGSRKLDDFFRSIGERVVVPQVSLLFQREGKEEIFVTVPNVHPGPLGEIGGSNLPKILHGMLGNASMVFHDSASHDFNPVDEVEVKNVGDAVLEARPLTCPNTCCTPSARTSAGRYRCLPRHLAIPCWWWRPGHRLLRRISNFLSGLPS